ncbi:MAG: glycosyltransferase [Anaerolineae bacterium]
MTDILILSSTDWHGNWGSRQQIARLWAAHGRRVLYVERMAGWEHLARYPDLRRRRIRRRREGVMEVEPGVWLAAPPPLLPGRYYLPAIARFNAAWVRAWLRPILRRLGFAAPLLWLYKPEQAALAGQFGAVGTVYHCIDEWTVGTAGRKKRVIIQLEAELLRRADVVFANSRLTFENKRPFNPHTYRLPSGVNIRHLQAVSDPNLLVPEEVAHLPRPVLAYVGNVDERIDLDGLMRLAQARPSWTLLFIGRVNRLAVDIEPLAALSNVILLGERPFAQLPALLRAADLCLLPYVQSEAARYRSPLKLYEYLATGLPIVSAPHPEVEEFRHLVTITPAAEFAAGIAAALAADTPEKRRARQETVAAHSWESRFAQILRHLAACGLQVTDNG